MYSDSENILAKKGTKIAKLVYHVSNKLLHSQLAI